MFAAISKEERETVLSSKTTCNLVSKVIWMLRTVFCKDEVKNVDVVMYGQRIRLLTLHACRRVQPDHSVVF